MVTNFPKWLIPLRTRWRLNIRIYLRKTTSKYPTLRGKVSIELQTCKHLPFNVHSFLYVVLCHISYFFDTSIHITQAIINAAYCVSCTSKVFLPFIHPCIHPSIHPSSDPSIRPWTIPPMHSVVRCSFVICYFVRSLLPIRPSLRSLTCLFWHSFDQPLSPKILSRSPERVYFTPFNLDFEDLKHAATCRERRGTCQNSTLARI